MTESKLDFEDGMTLGDYSEITRNALKENLESVKEGSLVNLNSNGFGFNTYPITGVIDKIKIRYWHTVQKIKTISIK